MSRPQRSGSGRAPRGGAGRTAAGRRVRTLPAAVGRPPSALAVALGVICLVIALAPAGSNYFWAVNGLRSLPWPAALGLALASAMAAVAAVAGRGGRVRAALTGLAIAIVVAFPLRERIHFLGDTQLRLRSMTAFGAGSVLSSFGEWSSRLHANPLDIAVNLMVPEAADRAGWPLRDGVSAVCVALALLYFAGLWRITARLGAAAELRLPIALALALTGVLEAFAGFAESAGLLAVATVWWWAEISAPVSSRRAVLRISAAWLVVLASHRMGVVLLLPQLWRALGPEWEGDDPASRRLLLGVTLGVALVGAAFLVLTPAGRQLGLDVRDLLSTLRTQDFRKAAPSDWINTLVLVAPLALLAPIVVGREGLSRFLRRPFFGLAMTLAVPLLLALVLVFPVGGRGLGAQRDWDANVILGLTLTIAAGALIAGLPAAALRTRLAWTLPVLALLSLGFVAVQANEPAAERRALAVAAQPPGLPDLQRSHAYLYLGQRAMDHGEATTGARYFDRAFELNANPRRALMAADAWMMSGDLAAARRSLERARARGPLEPGLEDAARRIELLIDEASAEKAGGPGDSVSVKR